jgi:hypothetical protein
MADNRANRLGVEMREHTQQVYAESLRAMASRRKRLFIQPAFSGSMGMNRKGQKEISMLRKLSLVTTLAASLTLSTAAVAWDGHGGGWGGGGHHGGWGGGWGRGGGWGHGGGWGGGWGRGGGWGGGWGRRGWGGYGGYGGYGGGYGGCWRWYGQWMWVC